VAGDAGDVVVFGGMERQRPGGEMISNAPNYRDRAGADGGTGANGGGWPDPRGRGAAHRFRDARAQKVGLFDFCETSIFGEAASWVTSRVLTCGRNGIY
jgi:hypothetical protein